MDGHFYTIRLRRLNREFSRKTMSSLLVFGVFFGPQLAHAAPTASVPAEITAAERIKDRLAKVCDGNLLMLSMSLTQEYRGATPMRRYVVTRAPTELQRLNNPELGIATTVFYYFDGGFRRSYQPRDARNFVDLAAPLVSPWEQNPNQTLIGVPMRAEDGDGIRFDFVRVNGRPVLTAFRVNRSSSKKLGFFSFRSDVGNGETFLEFANDFVVNQSAQWSPISCDDLRNPAVAYGKLFDRRDRDDYLDTIDSEIGAGGAYKSNMRRAMLGGSQWQAPSSVGKVKLGIAVTEVEPEYASETGAKSVVVRQVQPGGLADRAGLQKDDIILQINAQDINSARSMIEIVNQLNFGNVIAIVYQRDGVQGRVKVAALEEAGE